MPADDIRMEEAYSQQCRNNSDPTAGDLSKRRPSEVLVMATDLKAKQAAAAQEALIAAGNSNFDSRKSSYTSLYDEPSNNNTIISGLVKNGSSSSDSSNSSSNECQFDVKNYGNVSLFFNLSTDASTPTTPSALNTPDNSCTVPFLKNSLSAILDLSDEQADAIVHPLESSTALDSLTPVPENMKEGGWDLQPHSNQPALQPLEALKPESVNAAPVNFEPVRQRGPVQSEAQQQETLCEHSQAQIMSAHHYQPFNAHNESASSQTQQQNAYFTCTDNNNSNYMANTALPRECHPYTQSGKQQLDDILKSTHINSTTDGYPFTATTLPLSTQSFNGSAMPANNNFGHLLSMNQDYLHTNLTPMLTATSITGTSEAVAIPAVSPLPLPPANVNTNITSHNHATSAPSSIPNSTSNTPISIHPAATGLVTPPITNYFTQRQSISNSNNNDNNNNNNLSNTSLPIKPSVSYHQLPFAMTRIAQCPPNSHSSQFININVKNNSGSRNNRSISSNNCMLAPQQFNSNRKVFIPQRSMSSGSNIPTMTNHHPPRTYGRRASSHPSVASVVSLTAHEPVSKIIDGIEYISFLYSHDRLVKHYTVRTDIDSVNLVDISMDFRIQNAIYPRANVDRSEYDGNRWEYETTCNQLGWKLCWLNKEQLFGRRGLIQRAVDSYRNRHAEMRSRRVTRQEKVANGTLRKRRSKKFLSQDALLQ